MIPIWLTVLIAVLGPSGALAGVWISGSRAYRLAALDREAKRSERIYQDKRDACAKLLTAARVISPMVRADPDESAANAALLALRDAGAYVDLHAPAVADGPMVTLLDTADRLCGLVLRETVSKPVLAEAMTDYDQAFNDLRDRMRDDLDG